MARRNGIRPIIKLRSTAGTGYTYVTRKNRHNSPDRLVLKKYDPWYAGTSTSVRSAAMAKMSKNRQRAEVVARYADRRAELKRIVEDPSTGSEERTAAVRTLSRLPRDSSPVRLRNRDLVDGRPRGFFRVAGISRVRFREMAHRGELSGITKSSW